MYNLVLATAVIAVSDSTCCGHQDSSCTAVLLVSGGLCRLHRPVHIVHHFLRIIIVPFGEYCKDHSDQLPAQGYDRFHLGQRILFPRQVPPVNCPEFLIRCQHGDDRTEQPFTESLPPSLADGGFPFVLTGTVLSQAQARHFLYLSWIVEPVNVSDLADNDCRRHHPDPFYVHKFSCVGHP